MMRLTIPSFVLALILAGCFGGAPETSPGPPGEGWTFVDTDEALRLTLDDLQEGGLMIVELYLVDTGLFQVVADAEWDFPPRSLESEPSSACIIFSGGSPRGAGLGAEPFFVPERYNPDPHPEIRIGQGGTETHYYVRPTGTGINNQNQLYFPTQQGNTILLAFGLADHLTWQDHGARYDLIVGDDDRFYYRVVYHGTLDCRVRFEQYDQGEYFRTTGPTDAQDLAVSFHAAQGLAAFTSYMGDLKQAVKVFDPDGDVAYANGTKEASMPTRSLAPDSQILYSGETGDWRFTYPELEGTHQRMVWADTLMLDVPPEFQFAFPCTIGAPEPSGPGAK